MRYEAEKQQRYFCKYDQANDQDLSLGWFEFRYDFNPDEFWEHIAEDLRNDQDAFIIDIPQREPGIGAGREWLSERIHAEVGAKRCNHAPGNEEEFRILKQEL